MTKFDTLHIELSTFCNARCADCARVKHKDQFYKTHLDFWKSMSKIDQDILSNFERIKLCGNFGDPILHPEFLDIVKWLRKNISKAEIEISTNGEPHTVEWWKELAEILGNKGIVIFGIDGLKDTHSIYRENTNFDTIIRNATAFIAAGGMASWQFLMFEHNEKEILPAMVMSKKLGFKEFKPLTPRNSVKHNRFQKVTKYYRTDRNFESDEKYKCLFLAGHLYLQADGTFLVCCIMGNFYAEKRFSSDVLTHETLAQLEKNLLDSWKDKKTTSKRCLECRLFNPNITS